MSTRRAALRRYPALAFLLAAGLLATLLPSSLRLPLAGPASVAEVAPVPGAANLAGGDVADLGSASSGGLGFGGRGGGGGAGVAVTAPDAENTPLGAGGGTARRKPGTKRCVGNPPRQTEDPLSPPCIAFFDGDNAGATTRGVTGEEIVIVVHHGASTEERFIDYANPNDPNESANQATIGRLIRAYQRFFNQRYQTYGRFVHFYGYSGPNTATPEGIRSQIEAIDARWKPFALLPAATSDTLLIAKEAAARGIVAVNFNGADRSDHQELAPFLVSYAPDLQDQANSGASFVCSRLAGRPARHSGNITDRSRIRTFGLLWQDNPKAVEYARAKELFKAELLRQCNLAPDREAVARTSNEGQGDYPQNIAAMRSADITTLVIFSSTTGPSFWGAPAEAAKWYPEWVIPGSSDFSGFDSNSVARSYPPLEWANAFGLTYDARRGAVSEQYWMQAGKEGCPECDFGSDFRSGRLYNMLTLLFWGIQAAGPRLTPENLDKGLHAIPQRRSTDPSVPSAYFTPGNYSWVKDAAAIWWDNTGTEPGGNRPGCYRLVGGGARYRAGEWPAGDDGIKGAGEPDQPCQGPDR